MFMSAIAIKYKLTIDVMPISLIFNRLISFLSLLDVVWLLLKNWFLLNLCLISFDLRLIILIHFLFIFKFLSIPLYADRKQKSTPFLVNKAQRRDSWRSLFVYLSVFFCKSVWAHAVIGRAYHRRQYVTNSILQIYRRRPCGISLSFKYTTVVHAWKPSILQIYRRRPGHSCKGCTTEVALVVVVIVLASWGEDGSRQHRFSWSSACKWKGILSCTDEISWLKHVHL